MRRFREAADAGTEPSMIRLHARRRADQSSVSSCSLPPLSALRTRHNRENLIGCRGREGRPLLPARLKKKPRSESAPSLDVAAPRRPESAYPSSARARRSLACASCPAARQSCVEVASRPDCFLRFSSDDSTPESGLYLVVIVLFDSSRVRFISARSLLEHKAILGQLTD
ncbi:hypothetical protein PVAP13_5NG012565 [Panicum virgatum]|uniref:Uncharacterized protein n=1 Tax=Panicum virgatum TaxID=38727 RepID=A0A8T0S984_PANVG|nr:hypothetical protein PVAP13_5NG012565 [Panicum virgatum]